MSIDVPPGWSVAKVGETVSAPAVYGILQPGPDIPGGVPYVRPTEVQDHAIDVVSLRRTTPEIAAAYRRSSLRAGDVILSIVGTIGKVAVVPAELDGANITQSSVRIRVPEQIALPRYVAYALRAPQLVAQFNASRLGTAVPRLNIAHVRDLELPLAPREQQPAIVAAIESHFSRLDAATATLERVQRNLERYRASVLKAAVEGRLVPTEAELAKKEGRSYESASVLLKRILAERRRRWEEAELAKLKAKGKTPTDDRWKAKYEEPAAPDTDGLPELPEGWCWASIAQVASISGGITKNANREKLPMQRPYLRVANVYANELRLDEIKHIGVSADEAERTSLLPGDLLIVEGNGSVDQIGRVAMWDGSIPGCVHQNHIIKVRLSDQSFAKWSLTWLLSASGRKHIEGAASSTSGLHTLSLSKVASLPIPLAPSSEQSRVRLEVERLLSEQDHLQGVLSQACHRAGRLRQSILKWAFEGRLVRSAADHPLVDAALAGRR